MHEVKVLIIVGGDRPHHFGNQKLITIELSVASYKLK